jgi:hypothetical protein
LRLATIQQRQQGNRHEPEARHERIRTRERDRRQPVLAPRGKERPADGRHHAARQHRGNRAALSFRADRVGGGQPIVLRERLKDTDRRRARAENPETLVKDRPHGNGAAERTDPRAEHETHPPADARHQKRREDRRQRGGDGDQRERQRRERLVVGERVADEAGQRQIDRYR